MMDSKGNDCNNHNNRTPPKPEQSGEGLPYAPENWPEPGDVWGWRTGRRVAVNGNFRDRYLYLPPRLNAAGKRRQGFDSKLSVKRYVKDYFPHLDVSHFFASFTWSIPSLNPANADPAVSLKQFELPEQSESDILCDTDGCKAGNLMCSSLNLEQPLTYPQAMPCDICCVEAKFCRDCSCILCCRTVDSSYGCYSYIQCQVKVGDDICGHVAHLECALRCYLAGTVGGSIGLDAEYCCRRCDGITDLIPHAKKLLLTCEAFDTGDDDIKKKILNLVFCFLRGSQKAIAEELLSRVELAIKKLNRGTNTEDILKVHDNLTVHSTGLSNNSNAAIDNTDNESPLDHLDVGIVTESSGYLSDSLKLEEGVDQVLEALRKSQVYEYNLAEANLNAHKKYLQNLYQQLHREKSKLASLPRASHSDVLVQTVKERKEQLRRELMKFEDMKKIADGFGSTSKDILEKHFGL